MKLSYYTNIIKLKEDKYLLLKPFSRPIVVDKEILKLVTFLILIAKLWRI